MKRITHPLFVLLALWLVASFDVLQAQVSHGGMPHTMGRPSKQAVDRIVLDSVDVSALVREDSLMQKGGNAMRIGITRAVEADNMHRGTLTQQSDGSQLWRLDVVSPGASFVSLTFDRFELPEGAELFVYTPQGDFFLGRFLGSDVKNDGSFYTQAVPGDVCCIEYYEPAAVAGQGHLSLVDVTHGYKSLSPLDDEEKAGLLGSAGNCHIDVACDDAREMSNQIRAVCCITIRAGATYLCSGALMNNTSLDKTPYVLTAHHCQDLNSAVTQYVCYFNYQRPACGSGTGHISQSVTGATEVAKRSASVGSDFLLLRLDQAVPDDYEPYYAGWDRRSIDSPEVGYCIHHPSGDYKKISFPRTVVRDRPSYPRFYRATWQNRGVTEQGSSGSPLFNASGLVIGQLWAGTSDCSNTYGYDDYGSLDISWDEGTRADTRLSDWLDPLGTGVLSLAGMNYDSSSSVSVDANMVLPLQIYPNPSSGTATVEVEEVGEASYQVFTIDGRLMLESNTVFTYGTQSLNLRDLPNGMYVIYVFIDDKRYGTTLSIFK